jgi:hypothetical protein
MNNWGPNTWILFHTMAEKIKEEDFDKYFPFIWKHINKLCQTLPCPYCSEHASQYLRNYKLSQIKNKTMFKTFIFQFHNFVNNHTNKIEQPLEILKIYKTYKIEDVFNNFIISWQEISLQPNVNLMAHSFIRKKSMQDFHRWFFYNVNVFRRN